MILNNAPANQAIVSNVGRTGEFRIRSSAKAFRILSDGLYSNKIRAVVREISCNAYDSHVSAGTPNRPFEVHLPYGLEPWFSVRDFGVGLDDQQMYDIFTTYFESTKTESNDYVGALGLGSKSPFSYTENFTVTAIKNGVKNIYTAYINQAGMPDLACLLTEVSDEPSGLEIKFAVETTQDCRTFYEEARHVFSYFKTQPIVVSHSDFQPIQHKYRDRDIIPGIHYRDTGGSVAVMGNIAYPISIPDTIAKNDTVFSLLRCGLEMHFPIGDLEFQPSREHLGYDTRTVENIRLRLVELNDALVGRLAAQADLYENIWQRTIFLREKAAYALWTPAVETYIQQRGMPFAVGYRRHWGHADRKISEQSLTERFNIAITAFEISRSDTVARKRTASNTLDDKTNQYVTAWSWEVSKNSHFVINDTKIGATERAKYHWRHRLELAAQRTIDTVYVLNAADRTKPMDVEGFFEWMHNPPQTQIHYASTLKAKPRVQINGANISIMSLQRRGGRNYIRCDDFVWRDAGKADSFDKNETHYYVPLSGYTVSDPRLKASPHELLNLLVESGIRRAQIKTIYGVRKTDLPWVKQQKNWVNVYDHVKKVIDTLTEEDVIPAIANSLEKLEYFKYNDKICDKVNVTSPYYKFVSKFRNAYKNSSAKYQSLTYLIRQFDGKNADTVASTIMQEYENLQQRYRMLVHLDGRVPEKDIIEYIYLVDKA